LAAENRFDQRICEAYRQSDATSEERRRKPAAVKIISTKEFSGLTSGRIKPRLEIEL